MEFIDKFWTMVSGADSVVISSHRSPDDDAIGSVLAMYSLITGKYFDKRVEIIYTGEAERERYKSFAGFDKIRFVPDITDELRGTELLILVDGGQWGRFSNRPELLKNFTGKTVCIDHHPSKTDNFELIYVDKTAASCADLIYRLFSKDEETDIELARIYLLGILGDSGNFRYLRPDQTGVLEIGRKLLSKIGKSIQDFNSEYATISKEVFELTCELIKSTEYYEEEGNWPAWQFAGLSRKYVEDGGFVDVSISQAANLYMDNYLRFVSGYQWGVVMTPRNGDKYNLSFRSLAGSVNVRLLMERMGLGGGHDRAAGGTVEGQNGNKAELIQAKTMFLEWLKKNKREE